MGSLLETLITSVGTILVFALAAQSIQEMLKSIFAIKGRTMQAAIEGLVRESTRALGQAPADADAILVQVTAACARWVRAVSGPIESGSTRCPPRSCRN